MKAPRYNAEEYRIICIILVVIIVFMGWFWYQSEKNRLKVLDDLKEAESKIEDAESKIEDQDDEIIFLYEELGKYE